MCLGILTVTFLPIQKNAILTNLTPLKIREAILRFSVLISSLNKHVGSLSDVLNMMKLNCLIIGLSEHKLESPDNNIIHKILQ